MGFCKRTITLRQRKDCRIAVFSLNGGKLCHLLVVQCGQANLREQRVHARNVRVERRRFHAQLLRQRPHGERSDPVFFDQFFRGFDQNLFVQTLMKQAKAFFLMTLGIL